MDKLPYSCRIPASILCERILSPLDKGTRGVHFLDLHWALSPADWNPRGLVFPIKRGWVNGSPLNVEFLGFIWAEFLIQKNIVHTFIFSPRPLPGAEIPGFWN